MGIRAVRVTAAVVAVVTASTLVWAGCSSTTIIENAPSANGADAAGASDGAGGGDAGGGRDATQPDDDAPGTIVMPGTIVTPDGSPGSTVPDASASFGVDSGAPPASCPGPDLRCHVDVCTGFQATTSISGKVYDPAGVNPIPHVYVFVPADPKGAVPAITPGANSCDTCGTPIGSYVAATMTDATGSFKLTGVPTGQIPVVFQIGKWRREVALTTTSCQDTHVDPGLSRLPRSKAEGNLPQMALLTGSVDNLACLPTEMGIANEEITAPGAGGRVEVYRGYAGVGVPTPGLTSGTAGDCTGTTCPLWNSKTSLEHYDLVLLSCEGAEALQNKPAAAIQAMHDWLGEGGKVLATHFQYTWFEKGPTDFANIATWLGSSVGSGTGSFAIDTSFPRGRNFRDGLTDAGLISGGSISLAGVGDSVSAVAAPAHTWIGGPKYFSFTTPVGQACGKVGFSDVHAGGSAVASIPGDCSTATLVPELRALELLFFDLSACVSDDAMEVPAPPPSQ